VRPKSLVGSWLFFSWMEIGYSKSCLKYVCFSSQMVQGLIVHSLYYRAVSQVHFQKNVETMIFNMPLLATKLLVHYCENVIKNNLPPRKKKKVVIEMVSASCVGDSWLMLGRSIIGPFLALTVFMMFILLVVVVIGSFSGPVGRDH